MQAKLVVVEGELAARQYPLQLPAVVGRSRSADILLCHPLISRQHCELFTDGHRLLVRDLGSLNGTFIGALRLAGEPAELGPGEPFSLGPVTLAVEYDLPGPPTGPSNSPSGSLTVEGPLEVGVPAADVLTGDSLADDSFSGYSSAGNRPAGESAGPMPRDRAALRKDNA